MDKREYKLEKLKLRIEEERKLIADAKEFIKNPLVEFILGTMFIKWVNRDPNDKFNLFDPSDWNRLFSSAGMGMALVGIITAQQLSASLPYLAPVGEKLLDKASIGGLLK